MDSTHTLSRPTTVVQRPPMWTCKFFNDDYTPMRFVTHVLMDIYHLPQADARAVTMKIHRSGAATVGIYPRDVAEMKAQLTIGRARIQDYPLHVEAEKVPS